MWFFAWPLHGLAIFDIATGNKGWNSKNANPICKWVAASEIIILALNIVWCLARILYMDYYIFNINTKSVVPNIMSCFNSLFGIAILLEPTSALFRESGKPIVISSRHLQFVSTLLLILLLYSFDNGLNFNNLKALISFY